MRILITGGGGFLGSEIIRQLAPQGHTLHSLATRRHPHLDQLGVRQWQGDIADPRLVNAAVRSCDAVIHTAALAGVWGAAGAFHRTNVRGTVNVINACRANGVNRLVYSSSPSVVFSGSDQEGIDESAPYPDSWLTHYQRTKSDAEIRVLQANSSALSTVALRPHLIWGPGDRHLIPRILQRARAGRLHVVGSGDQLIDAVYIDNAARAHILALNGLKPGAAMAGRAYFITNHEPWPLRKILNGILAAAGLPPLPARTLPGPLAYGVGAVLEGIWKLTGRRQEPPMTRFLAQQLGTAHWYDPAAAMRDLGYRPEISMAEGLQRLSVSLNSRTS